MKAVKVKVPNTKSSCCSNSDTCNDSSAGTDCCSEKIKLNEKWITGRISTSNGFVPQVATKLSLNDKLGTIKARFGINRMNYKVNPGLYCVGNPDSTSPVLVTANYKMSFDSLRKELTGLNAWILVLDTKGINVWCAAGKGTFGTKELVGRLIKTKLSTIVSHRNIILPQLGAPGIIAHEVQRQSGFKVIYGPVRASDVPAFISSGLNADTKMRTVQFTFLDRLVLTPVELVQSIKNSIVIFGVLFVLNCIGFGQYGLIDLYAFSGAVFIGCVLTPLLLPWIPGRAFAFKGWVLGILWTVAVIFINGGQEFFTNNLFKAIPFILILPCVSAFISMNFTGSSTYTSLSGVKKEMRIAVPLMSLSTGCGIILLVIGSFIKILS